SVALALAVVGLYGVIAYAANDRTKEAGIRMALGARRADIVTLILRSGLTLAFIGIGIGMALALASTRFLSSQLMGVSATDPLVFIVVPLILVTVATIASYLPASRVANTSPTSALRYE